MNKEQLFLAITLIHATIFTDLDLLSFLKQLNIKSTPQLSANQIFQLNYLQEELDQDTSTFLHEWTDNQDARIVIERTELAIQQSSPDTQAMMKQKISEIFQQSGINIFFTDQNHIQKSNDHLYFRPQEKNKIILPKKAEKVLNSSSTSEPQHKIHGANKTRKRLQRAWDERHAALKKSEDLQKAQRSYEKKQITDELTNKIFQPIIQDIQPPKSPEFQEMIAQPESPEDDI